MCLFLSKREDHPENVNLKIGIYPQYSDITEYDLPIEKEK